MGRERVTNDQIHRFLWKYRNKIDNSVPWTQVQLAEIIGIHAVPLNVRLRDMAAEGRVYRLPKSHTYIVNDPRRYNAEGQESLSGGRSDA